MQQEKNPENQFQIPGQIPDKSLVFAKSTSIALFIVLLTLGVIFLIISLIK
jgi:hypothetical protein